MTRQQQRQAERSVRKAEEGFLRRGLPENPDVESIRSLAVVLRARLVQTQNTRRASQTAATMHAVYDVSLRKSPSRVAVACGKGCNYCCHTYVSVTPPEVFHIADLVRKQTNVEQVGQIIMRSGRTQNLTPDERHGQQLPCPLLSGGLCSVYLARPLMCRKAASTSAEDCRAVFEGEHQGWTMPRINDVLARASHYALCIALQSAGLPWHSYELSGALRATLQRPDGEAAWLAGEDVFAGVRTDPCPQEFIANVHREAGALDQRPNMTL